MASTPRTLTEAIQHFTNPDNCLDYLAVRRWPNGVTCPTCGRTDVTFVMARRLWQCKTRHPKAQFSVKTGTILWKIPPWDWRSGFRLCGWLPTARTALALGRFTARWESRKRQRGLCSIEFGWECKTRLLGGKLSGEVEVDETFIGGKARNMHKTRKAKA